MHSSKVVVMTPKTGLRLTDRGTLVQAEVSLLEAQLELEGWNAPGDWQFDRVNDAIAYMELAREIIDELQQPRK
ncbi:MAG: hypothetical protein AAGA97_02955 [Pseudomonadota bacterium]